MAQEFTGLPMESLIGAPLNAAANANASMAITQTKFLLDTCFQRSGDEKNPSYTPIMIKMYLIRGMITPGAKANESPKITEVKTEFNLPLLTIIPINSLAVEKFNLRFSLDITSQAPANSDGVGSATAEQGSSQQIQLLGKLGSNSNDSNSKHRSRSGSPLDVELSA